jgi:hypothetical protein
MRIRESGNGMESKKASPAGSNPVRCPGRHFQETVMEAQWITWALQGLIVFVLLWFKQQIDKNTDAVIRISVHLPEKYVDKEEFNRLRDDTDKSIHDLRDKIGDNKLAEALSALTRRG